MSRPVFGQENATIGLFKLEADGTHATRVQVKLGRSSVSQIEILSGLHVGDQVVLSDMSQSDTPRPGSSELDEEQGEGSE